MPNRPPYPSGLRAEAPAPPIAAQVSDASPPDLNSHEWSQNPSTKQPPLEGVLEPIPTPDPMSNVLPLMLDDGSLVYSESVPHRGHSFVYACLKPAYWLLGQLRTRHLSADKGIGYERVATAPFVIDIAQPMGQFAFRVDATYGWGLPDRAEALFASPNKRPPPFGPDNSVNFQDLGFIAEVGGPAFSVRTMIPVRILDPDRSQNTAGLGDIHVDTRLVLLDGKSWMLTQFMGTQIQSGSFMKGLGTGHFSLEPGVLASYKWSPETFLHGELRFLIPLGGDPLYQGNILRWGLGASHLWYDSDRFAVIPTVETVFHSILDGMVTRPADPYVDGETISTLHFGLRFVSDTGRDFGLVETGVFGGFNLGSEGWYDSTMRFEIRTVY